MSVLTQDWAQQHGTVNAWQFVAMDWFRFVRLASGLLHSDARAKVGKVGSLTD